MIYIYDILLNFNDDVPFEFFEWREEDKIEHIKKIPLYKVSRLTLEDFLYGKIRVDSIFLEDIYNKTEVYQNGTVEKIPYAAIFSDGTIALAVELNEQGESVSKSRLLLDEEEEVLEFSYDLREIPLHYICDKKTSFSYQTRFEKQMKHFLKHEFETAIQEQNKEKIKYFYEECFEKKYSNYQKASREIVASLDHLNGFHKKLYMLLKNCYQLRK